MQTSIAQIVALTIYGNAFLVRADTATGFYPGNSTFRSCEIVNFIDLPKEGTESLKEPFAVNPFDWFEGLKREGVKQLRMTYGASGQTHSADRMLVGFVGGGGRWLIEAQHSGLSDLWESRWHLGDRTRPDKKIWRVTYARIARRQSQNRAQGLENLELLSKELECQLTELEEFAHSQKLVDFAKLFGSVRSRLHSESPAPGLYHADLIRPDLLPVAACQLLAACQDAWVFGGMGSWNDQSFDPITQLRYEALSEQLYQLLNRAIVAAANSSSYGTLA